MNYRESIMKRLNILLIFSTLALMACQEQISEEIKGQERLTETEKEVAKYTNKAIRLVNTNDESLSYILHKAGAVDSACELQSPTLGFSAKDYDKTLSAQTIDCIMDAQELDIYFSGVKFEIQVDENLCEYIQYKPYRFLQFQPGSSTLQRHNINCDATCAEAYPTLCEKSFAHRGSAYTLGAIDLTTLSNLFETEIDGQQEELRCRFNYTENGGPNCDEGYISNMDYELQSTDVYSCQDAQATANLPHTNQTNCELDGGSWVATPTCKDNTAANRPTLTYISSTEFKCNGDWGQCEAGPAIKDTKLSPEETSKLTQNLELKAFTEEIVLSSPQSNGYATNISVANFSRICSSTSYAKTNAMFDTTLTTLLGHEVEDMPSREIYQGYAVDENGDGVNDYTIYGEHLFKGRGAYAYPTLNVQPYYAINCLDKAWDVKAQIRLFIRDWDREFDSDNAFLNLISDINQTTPLMDAYGDQQVGELWNDRKDLDDIFYDVDNDRSSDYTGNGNSIDSAFYNDQCTDLAYGYCSNRTYTNQGTCETNGGTWRLGSYCTLAGFDDATSCTAATGTWVIQSESMLFPGFNL